MTWDPDELAQIGDATELQLASKRDDGTLSPFTTMWVAQVDDDLYVRSAGGPQRTWYRAAISRGTGRIRVGDFERDVSFETPLPSVHDDLDATYHAKYDRYGPGPVGHVTGPDSHAVTIRLVRSTS